MRLDLLLVETGKAKSRAQAQAMIKSGAVQMKQNGHWLVVTKPSFEADLHAELLVQSPKYVSRGGEKMESALTHLALDVAGLTILDVGLSTGGFSDCLLQKGVAEIVGIDVGHGQLAEQLKSHSKLKSFEGINARELDLARLGIDHKFDLIVVDVSFISLTLILPQLPKYLATMGHILGLVKPQFELSAAFLNKKGVVKDQQATATVENKIRACSADLGLKIHDYFPCGIKGSDGNQEFFIYLSLRDSGGKL